MVPYYGDLLCILLKNYNLPPLFLRPGWMAQRGGTYKWTENLLLIGSQFLCGSGPCVFFIALFIIAF